MLIKYNPDIESEDEVEQTPLHTAGYYDSRQVVKLLVEHKAETIAGGSDKEIPLHSSVWCNNTNMAELLLNYKEDIKAKNKNNTHLYTMLPSTAKKQRHGHYSNIKQILK